MGGGGSKEAGGVPSPFPLLANFQDKLLQPPDDDSIRQTWVTLRYAIDAHARRFYHCERIRQTRGLVRESLRAAGVVMAADADAAQEAEDLSTLLHSPRHRRLGLRICIARVMVSSIDLHGHPDDTSLEPAVVELLRRFEALRPPAQPAPDKDEEAALAAWRMITAYFLQPGAGQHQQHQQQPCVDVLERVLLVFARQPEGDKDARVAGLVGLAGRAVELGEKIFCHAARWRFEWRPPAEELEEKLAEGGSRRRSIVVFPALLRSDEEGTKERGGLKYIIIKRKAVSAGSFFDAPVPVRQAQDSSSSSSSSGSDSDTPEEPPARGRRRVSRRN